MAGGVRRALGGRGALATAAGLFACVGTSTGQSSVQVTYSGYVVDNLCFDKCQVSLPGCDDCALDFTNVINDPASHTLHCIRDVQACIDSGYALMENAGTESDPNYKIRYTLDDTSNDNLWPIIANSPLHSGLTVTATGFDNGDGFLYGATFVPCDPNTTECTQGNCTSGNCLSTALTDDIQISIPHVAVLVHGSFLIVAWAFFAPLAWLFKRHTKTLVSLNLTRKVAGFPLGFLLHAGFMSAAVVCTIVGVSIALAEFEGRAILGHGVIGGIVAVVAIWQPLPGFFCRPAHGAPRRLLFNRVHRTGGAIALSLGAFNVVLGTFNYKTLWNNCIAPVFFGVAFTLLGVMAISLLWLEYVSRTGGGQAGRDSHTKSASL